MPGFCSSTYTRGMSTHCMQRIILPYFRSSTENVMRRSPRLIESEFTKTSAPSARTCWNGQATFENLAVRHFVNSYKQFWTVFRFQWDTIPGCTKGCILLGDGYLLIRQSALAFGVLYNVTARAEYVVLVFIKHEETKPFGQNLTESNYIDEPKFLCASFAEELPARRDTSRY